jgi:HSP20 family protein
MSIVRYSPFASLDPFRGFEETLNRFFAEPNGRPWVPPVDIRETDQELVLKADVERAFALPDTVNPEGVKAEYKNGTLTVMLPKKEIAKPRQIKVQVSN